VKHDLHDGVLHLVHATIGSLSKFLQIVQINLLSIINNIITNKLVFKF
jgi:hypothetical protein